MNSLKRSYVLAGIGVLVVATAIVAVRNAPRADQAPTVDRSQLVQIPKPQDPTVYDLSFNDDYHYTLPFVRSTILYAANSVASVEFTEPLGQATVVCDCSDASGNTPSGRHPGDAHDNGLNLDITYYMKTRVANPRATNPADFIVCSQYANEKCTGPADKLDVHRQAEFFASIAKLANELADPGDRELIALIGVDAKVKEALTQELNLMKKEECGFTQEELDLAIALMTSSKDAGWDVYHHHHFHLRFYNYKNSEAFSKRVDAAVKKLEKQV